MRLLFPAILAAALLLAGCHGTPPDSAREGGPAPAGDAAGGALLPDPGRAPMLVHLREHWSAADDASTRGRPLLLVESREGVVRVTRPEEAMGRLPAEAWESLGLGSGTTTMTARQYESFLDRLHLIVHQTLETTAAAGGADAVSPGAGTGQPESSAAAILVHLVGHADSRAPEAALGADDIVATDTAGAVTVRFSERVRALLPSRVRARLPGPGEDIVLTEEEYLHFLHVLHARQHSAGEQ